MIKLSEMVIMISAPDGTTSEFEPGEVKERIIRCFSIAGNDDLWAADDIVKAVEYALLASKGDEKIFSQDEVDDIINKILRDAGFPDVAAVFAEYPQQTKITVEPDYDSVRALLQHSISLPDKRLNEVTEQVIKACRLLKLEAAAPGLFIELGHYYLDRLQQTPVSSPGSLRQPETVSWGRISSATIAELLSPETREFITYDIVTISGIGALFPSLTIGIKLHKLAEFCLLTPPVTELILLPGFNRLAAAVDDIAQQAEKLLAQNEKCSSRSLHLCLSVPDMEHFATRWLDVTWPEGKSCCHQMMVMFSEMLQMKPYKIGFN